MFYNETRPVAEGGGAVPPKQEIRLNMHPHQIKIYSANALFLTNNQDIFPVVVMLICVWQTRISLWLSSLIARKLILLCLL